MNFKSSSSYYQLFISAAICMLIASCHTSVIKPSTDMKFIYEITEGEEANIAWRFDNANKVKIEGYEGSFFPTGAIRVKPEKSTKYRITAFRGTNDSLACFIDVDVLAPQSSRNEIRTGEVVLHEQFENVSSIESEYIAGKTKVDISEGPVEMKVQRVKINDSKKVAFADVLLLDKNGNFITGYGNNKNKIIWNSTNLCGETTANYSNLDFREISESSNPQSIDMAIMIDNSRFADITNIAQSIQNSISGLKAQDNVVLTSFNEHTNQMTNLIPAEIAYLGFGDNFIQQHKEGFSGLYDAIDNTISVLEKGPSSNKVIITITTVNDNASVLTDMHEVIDKLKEHEITLFIIGIGDRIVGHECINFCSMAGGKFYLLLPDETIKIQNIINEITFAVRNCYRVRIPMQTLGHNCNVSNSTLHFIDSRLDLNETINYAEDKKNVQHKIIAAGFAAGKSDIDTSFYKHLDAIAESLKKISDKKITITGYTCRDGNAESSKKIARLRAESIRNYLASRGIDSKNMLLTINTDRLNGQANTNDEWLQNIDRRVEISITDTMKQNYEIIVDNVVSEEISQNLTLEWEKRGYKAYFIRNSDMPLNYQVRLWGFKTKTEAEQNSLKLKTKYKINPIIE